MSQLDSARHAILPLDHLRAEMAAFPLASVSSLELSDWQLSPTMKDTGNRQSGRLWRAAEKHLLAAFPAFSLDEIIAIRDSIWFRKPNASARPLHQYLRELADLALESDGDAVRPRSWHTAGDDSASHLREPEARKSWRWLSFALPEDLFLGALGRPSGGPQRVTVLSPWLERHLADFGYAETHLHLGAALRFPLVWNGILYRISQSDTREELFESPGAALDEGRDLAAWLLRAAIARYFLAAFLVLPNRSAGFERFLSDCCAERVSAYLGVGAAVTMGRVLNDLRWGKARDGSPGFSELRFLYRRLTGHGSRGFPGDLREALGFDPVAPLLRPLGYDPRTPEVRFISTALDYLGQPPAAGGRQDGNNDFARLFWQVMRVRNLCYRHVVQRPMTPGLQWFLRFYSRIKPSRVSFPTNLKLAAAAELDGNGRGLKALELRKTPPSSYHEVKELCDALVEWNANAAEKDSAASRKPEIGVIFHFAKIRGGGVDKGMPAAYGRHSHRDPGAGDNPAGFRYGGYYIKQRRKAMALEWVLRHIPHSLAVIRGIDVCSDELGVPDWVMLPLIERIRCAARDSARLLSRIEGRGIAKDSALLTFRTTIHVGEDFPHLLTGLRHVDEAMDAYNLVQGDRIGHGVSLGIDPLQWARHSGHVAMSRETRLHDLTWEWNCYARQGCRAADGRLIYVERELERLSMSCFGEPVSPYDLNRLIEDLRDPWNLYRLGFPSGPSPEYMERMNDDDQRRDPRKQRRLRLWSYLRDQQLFLRGQVVEWVDAAAEGEALLTLQEAVRGRVGRHGLMVEINPSSNLLIGDLSDLTHHPLWRLDPPTNDGKVAPVSVCVGSDDPLTFASDLRQEYQLLVDAMAMAGVSDELARRWIDRVRTRGLEGRFTLESSNLFTVQPFFAQGNHGRPPPI